MYGNQEITPLCQFSLLLKKITDQCLENSLFTCFFSLLLAILPCIQAVKRVKAAVWKENMGLPVGKNGELSTKGANPHYSPKTTEKDEKKAKIAWF